MEKMKINEGPYSKHTDTYKTTYKQTTGREGRMDTKQV
jgi:hypothetical protein